MSRAARVKSWFGAIFFYKESRWSALILLLAGMLYAAAVVYSHPVLSEFSKTSDEYLRVRTIATEAATADQIAIAYRRARSALPAIEQKLNSPPSQATLVSQLARLARRTKVNIETQAFKKRNRKSGFSEGTHTVILSGRYGAVRKFISGLPNLQSWTTVTELKMERVRKSRQIRATIGLSTISRNNGKGDSKP